MSSSASLGGPAFRASDNAIARWWGGPWGRQLLSELALVVTVYLAYKQVRTLVRHQEIEAFSNAYRVVSWERAVGLFNELDLQSLATRSSAVISALNRYYVSVHFPITVGVIGWAYARHRTTVYRSLRFFLLTTTVVALAIHVAFPLAPPRMLPHLGFVDTLAEYGPRVYPSDPDESIANQFAAMPSLHFGWALTLACRVAPALRARGARVAVWAHPVVTLLAITATANHYWLDSVVGGALVLLAWVAWRVVAERRRDQPALLPAV